MSRQDLDGGPALPWRTRRGSPVPKCDVRVSHDARLTVMTAMPTTRLGDGARVVALTRQHDTNLVLDRHLTDGRGRARGCCLAAARSRVP